MATKEAGISICNRKTVTDIANCCQSNDVNKNHADGNNFAGTVR